MVLSQVSLAILFEFKSFLIKIITNLRHRFLSYNRAVWVDLTGDGRKSILTARAKSPSLLKNGKSIAQNGQEKGQLVWLEMPKPYSIDDATGTPLEEDGTVFDPFNKRHTPWKEQ